MKEFYTVGEVSKIFNIPASTLRYYDDIQLISPWKTGENEYRYYSKAQFEIISMIAFMRSLGTPINRLKEILNEQTADGIRGELRRYDAEIDERIAELQRLKVKVRLFENNISRTCDETDITLEELPDMYMMCKPFGEEDELDIDEIIKATVASEKWADTAGIVSTITVDDLYRGKFHNYENYGYISELPYPAENRYTSILPGGLFVCGSMKITTVEHFEADEAYAKMMKFIKKKRLTVTGPAIERNILDLYCGNRYSPTMYFRIYIPVKSCESSNLII